MYAIDLIKIVSLMALLSTILVFYTTIRIYIIANGHRPLIKSLILVGCLNIAMTSVLMYNSFYLVNVSVPLLLGLICVRFIIIAESIGMYLFGKKLIKSTLFLHKRKDNIE